MEKEESGFPITADVATRMLFALTPLGDELIKAVLGDVGKFIGEKGEIQKIFGDFPRHYVSLDYYRVSDRYVVDLEMQKSYDSHIVRRAWEYLNWIFHDNLLNPEEGKRFAVIVYLEHWMFKKDILVKKLIPDSLAETVDCQIYFVNINYHGKPIDSYLYRICRDFQAVEKGDFHHLQTEIILNVLEYYQNEGGKEEAMKEIDRIRETEYYRGEEKGKEEGKKEGKKEGRNEGRKEVLLNMCKDPRFTDLDIANIGGISVSEVVALRQRLSEAK